MILNTTNFVQPKEQQMTTTQRLTEIYAKKYDHLLNIAKRCVPFSMKSSADRIMFAEDLVQETFALLLGKADDTLPKMTSDRECINYVAMAFKNGAINKVRRRKRFARVQETWGDTQGHEFVTQSTGDENTPTESVAVAKTIDYTKSERWLIDLKERLMNVGVNEHHFDLIFLLEVGGLTYEEVQAVYDLDTVNMVCGHVNRARQSMAQGLSKLGIKSFSDAKNIMEQ